MSDVQSSTTSADNPSDQFEPVPSRLKKTWDTIRGSEMTCSSCGQICPRRGAMQKYCEECSARINNARKIEWAKNNPRPKGVANAMARVSRVRKISRLVQEGVARSDAEKLPLDAVFRDEAGMAWVRRVSVDFSYAMSKNATWSATGDGHIVNRRRSVVARESIVVAVRDVLEDMRVVENKLWIDLVVQKPDNRGDAINILDTVCDAIKVATGVDDRWFAIKGLDWQIVKTSPQILIGLGQESTEPVRACSYCGRLLSYDCFQKATCNRNGIGRECKDCLATAPRVRPAANCIWCGKFIKRPCRGRCSSCYNYLRTNGVDRPKVNTAAPMFDFGDEGGPTP